jgi:hypothetical protein
MVVDGKKEMLIMYSACLFELVDFIADRNIKQIKIEWKKFQNTLLRDNYRKNKTKWRA